MRWGRALFVLLMAAASHAHAQDMDQVPDFVTSDQHEAPPVRGTDNALSVKAFLDVAPQYN